MKISEELRLAAECPVPNAFYRILPHRSDVFARDKIGIEYKPAIDLSEEEKTLAYLFLAAIAESEGL